MLENNEEYLQSEQMKAYHFSQNLKGALSNFLPPFYHFSFVLFRNKNTFDVLNKSKKQLTEKHSLPSGQIYFLNKSTLDALKQIDALKWLKETVDTSRIHLLLLLLRSISTTI